ncbi:WD40 repeat domain-containing protein [Kibdelosporangium aridum]|uniref:hypothetical protein n=1 Tax=Kibdelosporangium aridum TaxID=2030 RepID=UPI00190EB054|nr:hypothetical protein [Kibdelosporangium aridum]
MTVETLARTRAGSVTQLVCHPRLPLVAGLDAERPAVHIWDCGELRELGTVGADSTVYTDEEEDYGRDRVLRSPAVAWHPEDAQLVVTGEHDVVQWTPAGLTELDEVPPIAAYRYRCLAFSPDGQRLWAYPSSSGDEYSAWEGSDVLDLASGSVGAGPRWDTGVAVHPAGGLYATLCSDQGATLCVFARPDQTRLRRALILDADGYGPPMFSADGRYLAIRGNAYENSLEVFEFPSLHRVLATVLGEPNPGYPYPDEWLDQKNAWSRHNIAFGATLWLGTPNGTLIEVDIDNQQAVEHDILAGSPVKALCATPTGELVVATGAGELVLLATGSAPTQTADAELVRAFLDSTSDVPDDGDLEDNLDVTDGTRSWTPDDRAAVTTATDTDPPWLQLTAAINNARRQA